MVLMDGEAVDMPLMDGDGLIAGDVPPPLADGVGMVMFIEPPILRSWWTLTHQFHTSPWTGPATYPIMWLSLLVHTMYSRPWVKVQNTRPAA